MAGKRAGNRSKTAEMSAFVTLHTEGVRHVTFAFDAPSKFRAHTLRAALISCGFDAHFAHEGKVEIARKGPFAGQELAPSGDWQVILKEGTHG